METIKEDPEREKTPLPDGHHPLLQKKVLLCLFSYMNVRELKNARLVCQEWNERATDLLQEKSIVRLRATCPLCNSEFNRAGEEQHKTVEPHSHARTIPFYRFVNRLSIMAPRERERLFFRNFSISRINLYLLGTVNTEPTKYLEQFVRLYGRKVFELDLEEVQLCPTDSILQIMSMFPNLDKLSLTDANVWADPLMKKGVQQGQQPHQQKPKQSTVRNIVLLNGEMSNGFLKSLSITKRWLSEQVLPWENIFLQCPHLQELKLENVNGAEMDECLAVLAKMRREAPERIKLRELVIFPEVRLEEELSVEVLSTLDHTLNPTGMESLTWKLVGKILSISPNVKSLRVHVGYDDHQAEYLPEILRGLSIVSPSSSLTQLILNRTSRVFINESELTFKWRVQEPLFSQLFKFQHIRHLEIAHNFLDNFDELATIFPSLASLQLNIVPVEFFSLSQKPYHTYVRTNLLISMKNSHSIMGSVRKFTWNVAEARNSLTKKRTVIYKTTAIRHLPLLFPNVTSLALSVTRASDLQIIFAGMPQLEELRLLRNSFHLLRDEDLIGPTKRPSIITPEDDGRPKGIRQLTQLQRLALENNNSAITNRSIVDALVYLRNLRSLHISHAHKVTLRGLRLLGACPLLVFVTVSHLKHEHDDDLDEIVLKTLIRQVMIKEALRRKEMLEKAGIKPEKKPPPSRIPTRIDPNAPSPVLSEPPDEPEEPEDPQPLEVDLTIEREFPIISLDPENTKSDRLTLRALMNRSDGKAPAQRFTTADELKMKRQLMLNLTDEERALEELERIWKEREERKREEAKKAGKAIGGKYELGPKYYKLGGKRYDLVRTVYKVNGKTYHLVRRVYESDGEGREPQDGKICRQTTKALKVKSSKVKETKKKVSAEPAVEAAKTSGGESESEYEHSLKDYEEEEDDEYLEEYCDFEEEDQVDDDLLEVLSGASNDPCATDEEDSVEEIFLDDPIYEGDKEFYDESAPEDAPAASKLLPNPVKNRPPRVRRKEQQRVQQISEEEFRQRIEENLKMMAVDAAPFVATTTNKKQLRFVEESATTMIHSGLSSAASLSESLVSDAPEITLPRHPLIRSAEPRSRPPPPPELPHTSRRVRSDPEFMSPIVPPVVVAPASKVKESEIVKETIKIYEIRREIRYDSARNSGTDETEGSDMPFDRRISDRDWSSEAEGWKDEEGVEEEEEEESEQEDEEEEEDDEEEEGYSTKDYKYSMSSGHDWARGVPISSEDDEVDLDLRLDEDPLLRFHAYPGPPPPLPPVYPRTILPLSSHDSY